MIWYVRQPLTVMAELIPARLPRHDIWPANRLDRPHSADGAVSSLDVSSDGTGEYPPAFGPSFTSFSILVMHDIRSAALMVFSTTDWLPATNVVSRSDIDLSLLRDVQVYLRLRSKNYRVAAPLIQSWEQFYASYQPFICQTLRKCRVPESDLENCAQDVWIEIVTSLPKLDYDPMRGLFRSWLSVLIRRKANECLRRKARFRAERLSDYTASHLPSRDLSPLAICEQREAQGHVRRVLPRLRNRLSGMNYRVLNLRWVEECSVSQVADSLELTPQQVRYRCHRVKQKARSLLNSYSNQFRNRHGDLSGVGSSTQA